MGSINDAGRKLGQLTASLKARDNAAMDFSELAKMLEKENRELLKLLLEVRIKSRGLGDIRLAIGGIDGLWRTRRRTGERQIKRIFCALEYKQLS